MQGNVKPRHVLLLVALSALWGATFMFTRIAAPVLGPGMVAALRMAFATLALAACMRLVGQRWPWAQWRSLTLLGLVAVALPNWLFSIAALHLPAAYSSLLYVVSVLVGAATAVWLGQEALTRMKLAGCLLGVVGCALLLRLGPVEPTPVLVGAALVMLLGAASSGVSTPWLKHMVRDLQPLAVTAAIHAAACVLLLPGAAFDLLQGQSRFAWGPLAAVAVMGVLSSGVAWWLFARLMQQIPPMAGLSSTFLITGFGVLWAVLFLGESVDSGMYAGGALILLGCAMVMGLLPPTRAVRPTAGPLPETPRAHD